MSMSRSRALPGPTAGEGWGGGGTGGTTAKRMAGAWPAGHRDTDGATREPWLWPPNGEQEKQVLGEEGSS